MVELRLINAIQPIQPDVTFIVANQNSPVPQHVFCEVLSIGDSFAGTPVFDYDFEESNNETESVSTITLYRMSISYNGLVTSKADSYARQMVRYLESTKGRLALSEQKLSVISIGQLQKMPLIKDADIYIKYVLDFTLATEEMDEFNVDVIDSVIVRGDMDDHEYEFKLKVGE